MFYSLRVLCMFCLVHVSIVMCLEMLHKAKRCNTCLHCNPVKWVHYVSTCSVPELIYRCSEFAQLKILCQPCYGKSIPCTKRFLLSICTSQQLVGTEKTTHLCLRGRLHILYQLLVNTQLTDHNCKITGHYYMSMGMGSLSLILILYYDTDDVLLWKFKITPQSE